MRAVALGFAALPLASATLSARANTTTNTTTNSYSALLSDNYIDLGIAQDAYTKAAAFVSGLTTAQKVSIITGSSFADNSTNGTSWDAYTTDDGGAGINMLLYVSAFSEPSALTMSWNKSLIQEQFNALGAEFYGAGYSLVDGPVSSPAGRVPESGRISEGFSFDAYLSGIAMGKAVTGMNAAGTITGARHFLFNEQETNRMTTTRYSSNVDDKTTQEVYLWPFADGVNAGLMGVMCAMNRVNDTLSCENNDLMSGYLKTQLGFPGFVFPDVSSQSTSYGSANAGLDYGSSSLWSETIIEAGIANGSLTEERLTDMAVRNVLPYYFVGLDNGELPAETGVSEYRDVRANHSQLIRRSAGESIVLLKNNNANGGGLPLNSPRTMSIYGAHAGPCMAGPNFAFSVAGTPSETYQGHLATAGGSGEASFPYLITPYEALNRRQADDGNMMWYILNNTYTSDSTSTTGSFPTTTDNSTSSAAGAAPSGSTSNATMPAGGGAAAGGGLSNLGSGTSLSPSFENYAESSAVCIVFINAWSGEGADRTELYNTEQDTMITTIADNCNNTVVVVNTVGPRLLEAWIEHENITAVLYAGLLGQESGNAIADVLYGDVNPSAKLTYTIPKNESDYWTGICEEYECSFDEGVFVDYRWFNEQNITTRYDFGYGLTYTNFTYGTVAATITNETATASTYPTGALGLGGQTDLFDEVIAVKTSISNSGSVDGAEVAQLYITFPDEAEQPIRVLRGFEKAAIAVGASADLTFSLRRRDISYWSTAAQKWAIASGDYTFSVGASSSDIRGTAKLTI